MDLKKMGKTLVLTGVLGVIVSLILYGPSTIQIFGLKYLFAPGNGLLDHIEAYHILIWISVVFLVIGGILFTSVKEPVHKR